MYVKGCSKVTLQRRQKHDHKTLSSPDIEENIGKMHETLKSDPGRNRKRLEFLVKLEF